LIKKTIVAILSSSGGAGAESSLLKQATGSRRLCAAIVLIMLCASSGARASETVSMRQLVCQTIVRSAQENGLPSAFLARLLWVESRYHEGVTSAAGASGIAQFMPETAASRGLIEPRNPWAAIAEAARFLAELKSRFGNLGLAAAAYNAGPERVATWLRGGPGLARQTQLYVWDTTGRRVEDWAGLPNLTSGVYDSELSDFDCLNAGTGAAKNVATADHQPWQVRLAARLARAIELFNATNRVGDPSATRIESGQPYSATRRGAASLCDTIRASGAACEVFDPLRN
jgi:hypothetical protein